MPLQATSGAASYDAFGGGVAAVPNYIEDVFSTWLYTGNDSTQTIPNGIDLSTKGGLVWTKTRNVAQSHQLVDTVRGQASTLISNSTNAASINSGASSVNSFLTTGYVAGVDFSDSTRTYASWTFREQPKFFDIQTFTTASNRSAFFNHSLGAVPGCVIIKSITSVTAWYVYHRSLGGNSYRLELNSANGRADSGTPWLYLTDTSIEITSTAGLLPQNQTYVAYIFAHDSGGFGLSGTDNVISCGSFTTDGSGKATVNLGYEPQWIMVKRSSGTGDWVMVDTMRGLVAPSNSGKVLWANLSNAENDQGQFYINSTGFTAEVGLASNTYIYIAIRRGPMKTPTTGTSVFAPLTYTGNGTTQTILGPSLPTDLFIGTRTNNARNRNFFDRLRGSGLFLRSDSTLSEANNANSLTSFAVMNGVLIGSATTLNETSEPFVGYFMSRAPGFMDVCCYTGTGSGRTLNHNLGVTPELMICKVRSTTGNWVVYVDGFGGDNAALNTTGIFGAISNQLSGGDATTFTVSSALSASNETYVAYLFASCPGVSKVGSYTGTGTTQVINCGFTAGARFVLIKRTDSTGDWYVWDSARGIVAGNDPYLLLNVAAAEVTNTDYIDTDSTGFEISSTAPAAINANGGTFIFLAIA